MAYQTILLMGTEAEAAKVVASRRVGLGCVEVSQDQADSMKSNVSFGEGALVTVDLPAAITAAGLCAWHSYVLRHGEQPPQTLLNLVLAGCRFAAGATPEQEYAALVELAADYPNLFDKQLGTSLVLRIRKVMEGLVGGQNALLAELASRPAAPV